MGNFHLVWQYTWFHREFYFKENIHGLDNFLNAFLNLLNKQNSLQYF